MQEIKKVEISTGTILKIILILLSLLFLYLVKEIIALFIISIIVVSAIDPAVNWLHKKRIPRSLGVLLVYFAIFSLIGLAGSFLIPPIATQFSEFSKNIPSYFQQAGNSIGPIQEFFHSQNINISNQSFFDNIGQWISNIPGNIFSTTVGVFSGLISIVVVLSLAFYMAVVEDGIRKFIVSISPKKYEKHAVELTDKIKYKIGKWMQGEIVLMISIFGIVYLGLSLIGIPYALVLAVFAGLLEIVPYVGPIISAIPGVILGFLISPLTGFLALLVYIVSQQLENNILVPLIMKRAVGLNPVAIILALLAGAKIGGALGAILAVPVAAAIGIVIRDMFFKENKNLQEK